MMASLRHSIWFFILMFHIIRTEDIDSNSPKTRVSDESINSQLKYESNIYSSHPSSQSSLPQLNTNGYNNHQNIPLSESSSSSQIYSSGIQKNDKKERKALILAIPVKLSLPNGEADNFDSSATQPVGETTNSQNSQSSLLYSSNSYLSQYPQSNRQSFSDFANSDDSDQNVQKSTALPPLSHKIYPTLDSQSKSSSYSMVNKYFQKPINENPSNLGSANDNKYKPNEETNDYKLISNLYPKSTNNYRQNPRQENKNLNNEGNSEYANNKYSDNKSGQTKYDDSYEAKNKLKEQAKQLYDSFSDSKQEDDYDSASDSDDDYITKAEDNYDSNRDNQKNRNNFNFKNNRKNVFNGRGFGWKPDIFSNQYNYNRENSQSMPALTGEPLDGWQNYFYKSNINNWPQMQDSMDGNFFNILNGYANKNMNTKDNVRNSLYAPAFDLMADTQLKSASTQVPYKSLQNSKIYGPLAANNYQPINMFAGYGRDYSLFDMNGELYPAPLVAQTPPRKQHNLQKYNDSGEQAIRDSFRPTRKNPLLLRPNFMSGLRSAANKPLVNYSPFASASSTHPSFLSSISSLPTVPNSFNINKSIPRQIFPLFYG